MSLLEMRRRKRIKVLLFVLILIFLGITKGSSSPNLLSVIKSDQLPYETVCIADKNLNNSGIGWIFPIPNTYEEMPTVETRYIPEYNSEFSCDFSVGSKCFKQWKLSQWNFSGNSDRFQSILDSRADAFPTIFTSNSTKEFNQRIEIPHTFNIGLSIRSSHYGEVLFCEGWNPLNYPCYYLNIGGNDGESLTLKKFKTITRDVPDENAELAKFNGTTLTSEDEWRSYKISFDATGKLEVSDLINKKTILAYTDQQMLKPIYLILKSNSPVLWKIHKFSFIYTTEPGVTKLGPSLTLNSNDLCVSLFVSSCDKCYFNFSLVTEAKQEVFLLTVKNYNNETWRQIELKKDNLVGPSVKIHVRTAMENESQINPFWAISNVRVCDKKELRVSKILFTKKTNYSLALRPLYDIACQSLRHPTWRPTLYKSPPFDLNLTKVSTEPTNIVLQWETSTHLPYQPYYSIEYQVVNKTCNASQSTTDIGNNFSRSKSFGFSIIQNEDIKIENLVPYTEYNVSVTDLITNKKLVKQVLTEPTELITLDEMPKNVSIQVGDTFVKIKWKRPPCNKLYGPIAYKILIKDEDELLQSQEIGPDELQLNFLCKNLEPFKSYIIEIISGRMVQQLNNSNLVRRNMYRIATSPSNAPMVNDLEISEIDKNYAYLRYRLPDKPFGVPQHVKVKYCNPITYNNCTVLIQNITKCMLWQDFYCAEVIDLIPGLQFTFSVSIKNANTETFGIPTTVNGLTIPHKPGSPSNLTYDHNCYHDTQYCNIKITWSHPRNPKGLITAFRISLFEKDGSEEEVIEEIYKIPNRMYQKTYSHLIKYIPYGTQHVLSVEGINNNINKGDSISVDVTVLHHQFMNVTPTLNTKDSTLMVTFPPKNHLQEMKTYFVIQDFNKNVTTSADIPVAPCFIEKCHNFGSIWLGYRYKETMDMKNNTIIAVDSFLTIDAYNKKKPEVNKLSANKSYCVIIVTRYNFDDKSECEIYSFKNIIIKSEYQNLTVIEESPVQMQPKFASVSLILTLIFIFISLSVVGILLYRRYRRRHIKRRNCDEHFYEQMPFDDLEESVHNPLYDRLVHS